MLARSAEAGRIIRQHETGGVGDNESGPRTGKRRDALADRSPARRDAGGGSGVNEILTLWFQAICRNVYMVRRTGKKTCRPVNWQ